jgi:hypothetical protein
MLLLQKAFTLGFGLLLVIFVGWVIKRRFIDRKPIPPGVADATRASLMNMMNADQRAGLEHQMYMEQDETREDDAGGPRDPER